MTTPKTRRRRTRAELTPGHDEEQAQQAFARIRALRSDARDPDLDFCPDQLGDDDDLAAVIAYLATHQQVPAEVRLAELPDRALLIQYRWQQALERHERDVLAVLDAGHQLGALPGVYGLPLGLVSRQMCWNRRRDLSVKYHAYGVPGATAREKTAADRTEVWLTAHRGELVAVGELLVDHREQLLGLVSGEEQWARLAEAIDAAGWMLAQRPTPGFAAAIAYAMFLLRPNGPSRTPADPILREGLATGTRLREEFNKCTTPQGK